MDNLPRSGGSAFYWHLTPWPPLLESLSRAKAREEGEKGVGGKGGEVYENNENLTIDNTEWTIFRAAELYYPLKLYNSLQDCIPWGCQVDSREHMKFASAP